MARADVTFRVIGGRLDLSSNSIACRLSEGRTILTCTVARQVLRDLGGYHRLQMSDEAIFSRLLPEIERLANALIRAGRVDDSGNLTLATSDLVRYGLGSLDAGASE